MPIDGQGHGPDLTSLRLFGAISDVDLGFEFPHPLFVFPDLGLSGEPCTHGFVPISACDEVVNPEFVCVLEDLGYGKVAVGGRVDLDGSLAGTSDDLGGGHGKGEYVRAMRC